MPPIVSQRSKARQYSSVIRIWFSSIPPTSFETEVFLQPPSFEPAGLCLILAYGLLGLLRRDAMILFDWFSQDSEDAISLLKRDHDTVKVLFDRFEKADGAADRRKIVTQAITELKMHAALEEEIFYPAVRKKVGEKVMNEADEEHHVAKVLIAELEKMDGRDEHYSAKFTVLAENVRHHIKEEEGEMLPQARSLDIDFEELGQQMLRRKNELLIEGVPPAAEEKMVARKRVHAPAKAAQKTTKARSRKRKAA